MLRYAIFDVDGTLLDSVDLHARSWQETFRRFGKEVPFEAVRKQIGKGGDQLMPVFLSEEEVARKGEEIEAYRLDLFKREYLPQVRPFPKVRELFERILRDGVRIVLASSAKPDEMAEYKRIADIGPLVLAKTSSGDADRSKPHPDIFEATLELLASPTPDEVFVVGDSPSDAEAAGKARLRTIGLLCGGFPEEELRRAGCIALYRDPADLLARYDDSPLGREARPGPKGQEAATG
jgi:HAD superfamily hydrolase (TIGR01549 family)